MTEEKNHGADLMKGLCYGSCVSLILWGIIGFLIYYLFIS